MNIDEHQAATTGLINPEKLRARVTRRWVCKAVRTGCTPPCFPDDPCKHWECGYRNELSLTDEEMEELTNGDK